jgi:hypothetical protein
MMRKACTVLSRSCVRGRLSSDWILYVLYPLAAVCLPWMVRASGWFPGAEGLARAALWAGLAALILSYSRWRSETIWLVGLLLGLAYSMDFGGDLAPPKHMLQGDLERIYHWVQELVVEHHYNTDLPLSFSATYIVDRNSDLAQRIWEWVVALQQGSANSDNAVLRLAGCLLVWLLTWNLGYHLFRSRRGLAGLAPLGITMLASVSFTGVGTTQAQIYFGLSLVIWLWSQAGRMQLNWATQGTGVEPHWRRHLLSTGFPVASLVFVVALAMPYKSYDRAVHYFWEHMGDRLQTFYQKMDRAFAGRNPLTAAPPEEGASEESASLGPHDIRGGVSASDQPILLVRTSDPAPDATGRGAPKRYWRERTYDIYTGYGWASSPLQAATFAADADWKEVGYRHQVLTQTFTRLTGQPMAVAVNEPIAADHPYSVLTRGAGDLAAMEIDAATYTITSWVPDATAEELQKAEGAYADWVAERYLGLPEVPQRIRIMAERVVQAAQATTRYDKAAAIEAYLRGYAYDVYVPPPPWDTDVVEYFLFTAKRGYCDYSATAMVVMLRSLGVAARYASGYGQGTWDAAQGGWVVSGQNSHAWAEVYYPGYGWIEFEPTPSQGTFTRATTRPTIAPTPVLTDAIAPEPSPAPPLDEAPATRPLASLQTWTRDSRLLSALIQGGLLVILLGLLIYSPRLLGRSRAGPRELIWRSYGRLQLWGRLVGIVPQDSLTPRESLQVLQREMQQRRDGIESIADDVGVVQSLYEQACYSSDTLTIQDGARAWEAWTRLRGPLSRMLWTRLRQDGGNPD